MPWSFLVPFLEKLLVADDAGLAPGIGSLTVFTNEKGGSIDDSFITKVTDDHIYLVVNVGCRDKDLAHIEEHMKAFKAKGGDVDWRIYDERSFLALQGPLAGSTLQHLTKEDSSKMYFGEFHIIDINGAKCFLTRTGLGSLGLLAMTWSNITPVEAGLTIGKRRSAEGGFLGADVILKQSADGPTIRRARLFSSGPPVRSHSEIQNENGDNIGEVTSSGFSPCLKKNIAMGYEGPKSKLWSE